jgi:hypothetical protein
VDDKLCTFFGRKWAGKKGKDENIGRNGTPSFGWMELEGGMTMEGFPFLPSPPGRKWKQRIVREMFFHILLSLGPPFVFSSLFHVSPKYMG